MVRKGSGWHGEPKRHSEAVRKGMKTRSKNSSGRYFTRKTPRRIQNMVVKKIETKPIELFPGEETELRELSLFAENTENIYNQYEIPIVKNMLKKIKAGTYSPELAVKGWRHWADASSKGYSKEFGDTLFTPKVRNELAKRKALIMKKMIDDGEFDHLK